MNIHWVSSQVGKRQSPDLGEGVVQTLVSVCEWFVDIILQVYVSRLVSDCWCFVFLAFLRPCASERGIFVFNVYVCMWHLCVHCLFVHVTDGRRNGRVHSRSVS